MSSYDMQMFGITAPNSQPYGASQQQNSDSMFVFHSYVAPQQQDFQITASGLQPYIAPQQHNLGSITPGSEPYAAAQQENLTVPAFPHGSRPNQLKRPFDGFQASEAPTAKRLRHAGEADVPSWHVAQTVETPQPAVLQQLPVQQQQPMLQQQQRQTRIVLLRQLKAKEQAVMLQIAQSANNSPTKASHIEHLNKVRNLLRRGLAALRGPQLANRPTQAQGHGTFQTPTMPLQQLTPFPYTMPQRLPNPDFYEAGIPSQLQQGAIQTPTTLQQEQMIPRRLQQQQQPNFTLNDASVVSRQRRGATDGPRRRQQQQPITIYEDEPQPRRPHTCEGFTVPEEYTKLFKYDSNGFPQQEATMTSRRATPEERETHKTRLLQRLEFAEGFKLAYSTECMLHHTLSNTVVSLLPDGSFKEPCNKIAELTSVDALRSIKYMRCGLNNMNDFAAFIAKCAAKDQKPVQKPKPRKGGPPPPTPSPPPPTIVVKIEELQLEPRQTRLESYNYVKDDGKETHNTTRHEDVAVTVDGLMPRMLTRYQQMTDDEIITEYVNANYTSYRDQGLEEAVLRNVRWLYINKDDPDFQKKDWYEQHATKKAMAELERIRSEHPQPVAMDIHRLLRYADFFLEHTKTISINLDWTAKDILQHRESLNTLRNTTSIRMCFRKVPECNVCQLILRRPIAGEKSYEEQDGEILQWLPATAVANSESTPAMFEDLDISSQDSDLGTSSDRQDQTVLQWLANTATEADNSMDDAVAECLEGTVRDKEHETERQRKQEDEEDADDEDGEDADDDGLMAEDEEEEEDDEEEDEEAETEDSTMVDPDVEARLLAALDEENEKQVDEVAAARQFISAEDEESEEE